MKFVATIFYIFLQIVFIPFAIIGAILISIKQILISRLLGVSGTAIEVINGRWTMHQFGIYRDDIMNKLINELPNASVFGNWLVQFPLWIRHKLTGELWLYPKLSEDGEEGLNEIIIKRSIHFNRILKKHKRSTRQFVVFGAGFDTRCYGLMKDDHIKCFEIDKKNTQELKMKSLDKAGIDRSHVSFVEVDFSKDEWFEKLSLHGYNPSLKTMFLWEGVTLYLLEEDIRKTLSGLKKHSSPESILAADWYEDRLVSGEMTPGGKFLNQILKIMNEELKFSVDLRDKSNHLNTFIEEEGLDLISVYEMGRKTSKGTYMAVTEIQL